MGSGGTNKSLVIQVSLSDRIAMPPCRGKRGRRGKLSFVLDAGGLTSDSGMNRWVTSNYQVPAFIDCPDGCSQNIASCSSDNGTLR